jgi:hypothetical protein
MLRPWTGTLKLSAAEVRLLVTTPGNGDLLRARVPLPSRHPRALLTMLEGLALWRGEPLRIVIGADSPSRRWSDSGLFGDELWPGESPLVRFEAALRARRVDRLRGLGDFRELYAVATGELPE